MRKMVADVRFTYRGIPLKVGQEFDADEEHVELFKTIGHAHVAEASDRGQSYLTRVMTAENKTRRRARAAH